MIPAPLTAQRGARLSPRTLLVINADVSSTPQQKTSTGVWLRRDYLELQRALEADIVDLGSVRRSRWAHVIARLFGESLAESLLAWRVSPAYDVVYADRETTGFAIAALSKLRRRSPRLVMIGHQLRPAKKRLVFRLLRLGASIDSVIVHSTFQQQVALQELGLESRQVALIPYHCDQQFWRPCDTPMENKICSVGYEHRDYATLLKAVADLDLDVEIAASNARLEHRGIVNAVTSAHVHVSSLLDPASLRRMYEKSLFVVVPLQDVEFQAGITTILEAMAMGKAVVVSHTRGQTDAILDRRRCSRFDPDRPTQPPWIRDLDSETVRAVGQTGLYVRPEDPQELHRAITFLLEHPDEARRMGLNGRRVIEETLSLDHFTARVAALIKGTRHWNVIGSKRNRVVPEATSVASQE